MSLSRSPSPRPDGGWSSPGLVNGLDPMTPPEKESIYGKRSEESYNNAWASAKARSDQVRKAPSFTTRNEGFFARQKRKISTSLPRYRAQERSQSGWSGRKENPTQSGSTVGGKLSRLKTLLGNILRKLKVFIVLLILIVLTTALWSKSNMTGHYRRAARFGGGSKFVMILAANQGGGVMEWKGPREWAIERDSIKNKKQYAARWGYELEIVDMSTKKRYAHEWRESWEKVDTIRSCLKKYPDAEWLWWLDLNTFIMEPSQSLQSHIFNRLSDNTYRDINRYNPLGIQHPPAGDYLDATSLSPVGDNRTESIDLIVPQDCAGFTLGSFFMRRSQWTERLLDVWWDPVCYEQKHMQWEHKEQDALEHLYTHQPWVRSHTAFISQRKLNAYPPAACGSQDNELDERFHYHEQDRDFMVNLAGCEWGRDCWAEMYHYRQLSNHLNRSSWKKFKDWVSGTAKDLWKKDVSKSARSDS